MVAISFRPQCVNCTVDYVINLLLIPISGRSFKTNSWDKGAVHVHDLRYDIIFFLYIREVSNEVNEDMYVKGRLEEPL